MSDPHAIHRHGRITMNATLALAAHQGVILDQDGHTVVLVDVESLRETVARVLFARHDIDTLSRWEDKDSTTHARWKGHADAVIDAVPTTPRLDLARLIHGLTALEPYLTNGALARCLITAEHVHRIVCQRARRELERAQAEASPTTRCPVCGAARLTAKCVLEQHGITAAGA
ncbi:hypothetical protein [Oerskovia paurometabola]|uniref:hypothetical protein n=1 Tax=Oerskovia paurometabola TaxID=162170 RepID=UPI003813A4F0